MHKFLSIAAIALATASIHADDFSFSDKAFTDLLVYSPTTGVVKTSHVGDLYNTVTSMHPVVRTSVNLDRDTQLKYITAVFDLACELTGRKLVSRHLVDNKPWGEIVPFIETALSIPHDFTSVAGARIAYQKERLSGEYNGTRLGQYKWDELEILREVISISAFSKDRLSSLAKMDKVRRIKLRLPIVTKDEVNPIEQDIATVISACNQPYYEGLSEALAGIGVTIVTKELLADLKASYENREDEFFESIEAAKSAKALKYMYGVEAYNDLVKALNGEQVPASN